MIPIKEAQLIEQQQSPQTRTTTLYESKYSDHYYHCTQNNGTELQLDYQRHYAIDATGSSSSKSSQKVVLPAEVTGVATALQVAPVLLPQPAALELGDDISSVRDAAVAMANNNITLDNNGKHDRGAIGANDDTTTNNNFNNNHSSSRDQIPNKKPESWREQPEWASLVGVSGGCVSDCNDARTLRQADALTSLLAHVDKVRREVDQLVVGTGEAVVATASSADEQQEGTQQIKRALKLLGINLAPNLNSPIASVNKSAFIEQHQTEPSTMSAAPGLLCVGSAQAAADFFQFSTVESSKSGQEPMASRVEAESALNENSMRFDGEFSKEAENKQHKNANTLLIIQHLEQRRNELKIIDKQLFVLMRKYLLQLDCFQQAAINDYIWSGAEFSPHLDFNNAQVSLNSVSQQQQQQLEVLKVASETSQLQESAWRYHRESSSPASIGNLHCNYLASWCGSQPELAGVVDLSLVGRDNQRLNCAHQLPLELALQPQQSQDPLRSASLDSSRTNSSFGKASSPNYFTNVPAKETRAPSVNPKKTRLLGLSRLATNEQQQHQQQSELSLQPATNNEVFHCQRPSENLSTCSSSHPHSKPDQTSLADLPNNSSSNNEYGGRKNEEQQFKLQLQQQLTVATVDGVASAGCSTFDSTTMGIADEQAVRSSSGLTASNSSPLPNLHVATSSSQQKLSMTIADKLGASNEIAASNGNLVADHDDVETDAGPARKKFRSWPQLAYEQQQQQRIDLGSQQAEKPDAIISDSMVNSMETNNLELIYALHQHHHNQQHHLFSQYLGQHNHASSLSPMHLIPIRNAPGDSNYLINSGRFADRFQFNPIKIATSADYRTKSSATAVSTTACLLFNGHDDSLACAQNPTFSNHHLHHQSTIADGLHSSTTSIAPAHRIAISQAGHHQQHHAIATPVNALISQQSVQTRDLQRPIAYRCHVCGSGFEDRHRLQQHLSIHLNLHPSWFEERTIKETMAQYESKRGDYLCTTCNLRFDTTAEFDRHMHLHGEKPHQCEFCNQDNKLISFRYYRQLLTHLRSHCFLYSCKFAPDCKQTANRKDYLKLHILKHHLNNKLPEQYTFCCH